jgi:hypothetical protein
MVTLPGLADLADLALCVLSVVSLHVQKNGTTHRQSHLSKVLFCLGLQAWTVYMLHVAMSLPSKQLWWMTTLTTPIPAFFIVVVAPTCPAAYHLVPTVFIPLLFTLLTRPPITVLYLWGGVGIPAYACTNMIAQRCFLSKDSRRVVSENQDRQASPRELLWSLTRTGLFTASMIYHPYGLWKEGIFNVLCILQCEWYLLAFFTPLCMRSWVILQNPLEAITFCLLSGTIATTFLWLYRWMRTKAVFPNEHPIRHPV